MTVAYREAARELEHLKALEREPEPDLKQMVACRQRLMGYFAAAANAAKDAAPYRHRKLFGDKPREDDEKKRQVAFIVDEERSL